MLITHTSVSFCLCLLFSWYHLSFWMPMKKKNRIWDILTILVFTLKIGFYTTRKWTRGIDKIPTFLKYTINTPLSHLICISFKSVHFEFFSLQNWRKSTRIGRFSIVIKWKNKTVRHYLVWLEVQYHQVSVTDIEARQMITSILGIKNVLIYNKCSSLSLGCIAPVNNWRKLTTIFKVFLMNIY